MQPGTRIGPYEVVEKIGEGGMGAVYRASDPRLGRDVALKVLPEQFARDSERLARFEREARASAALSHPNIAQVFDVGAEGDVHYFVQELLDGRSLREVLDAGPMELSRVRTLGGQIASALRAAHAAGVVHRDLKPENVFVTAAGYAKVLDFGLAKLIESAPAVGDAANSPTMLGTQVGVIMGTAGYMAPEQVNAGEVDHRADLFALGCLLFEMVTGARAFPGDNVHDVLNRVLTSSPDITASSLRPLPPRLRWLVQKALAKDPDARYQTAADLAIDLDAALDDEDAPDPAPAVAAPVRSSGAWRRTAAAAALALVVGAAAGALWSAGPPSEPPRGGQARFAVDVPDGLSGTFNRMLASSPDGRWIATGGVSGVTLYELRTGRRRVVGGEEVDRLPFFSPDSEELGYWAGGQFHRLDLDRGTSAPIGPTLERPFGVHWADDGYVYYGRAGNGIWRLPAAGGEPEQVVALEAGQHAHGPMLLPGGDWLLFTRSRSVIGWRTADIVARSLRTGDERVLVGNAREARYVPGGYLVWVRDQTLMADTFDLEQMQLGGRATVLEENVLTAFREYTGAANYDFSATGVLAYLTHRDEAPQVFEVYREGESPRLLPLPQQLYGGVRYGPGDRQLAVQVIQDDTSHVIVYDLARESELRVSTGPTNSNPVWSPDGRWLYYASLDGGSFDIVRRPIDLSTDPETVLSTAADEIPAVISRDGEWLYFETRTGANSDIGRLRLDGTGEPELLLASAADETGAGVSPDGRFLLFQSDTNGSWAIYALEIETGARHPISGSDAYLPVWARSGDRIYYRTSDGVFVVDVRVSPTFETGVPRRFLNDVAVSEYEVTEDGRGALMISRADNVSVEASDRMRVMVGWFDELREVFDDEQ